MDCHFTLKEMYRIQKISECFIEWLRRDTWYTSHPNDLNEFYYGLKGVCQRFRGTISTHEFAEAIRFQLSRHMNDSQLDHSEYKARINRFAKDAAMIYDFYRTTKRSKPSMSYDRTKYFSALCEHRKNDISRVKEYYNSRFGKRSKQA